jgi:hypothetical protein
VVDQNLPVLRSYTWMFPCSLRMMIVDLLNGRFLVSPLVRYHVGLAGPFFLAESKQVPSGTLGSGPQFAHHSPSWTSNQVSYFYAKLRPLLNGVSNADTPSKSIWVLTTLRPWRLDMNHIKVITRRLCPQTCQKSKKNSCIP